MSILAAQIVFGILLGVGKEGTRAGGLIWEEWEGNVIGMHCMTFPNNQ